MKRLRFPLLVILSLLAATILVRCSNSTSKPAQPQTAPSKAFSRSASKVQGVNLNDSIEPKADDDAIALTAAKNEWSSFAVQVSNPPKPTKKGVTYSLRVGSPRRNGASDTIEAE